MRYTEYEEFLEFERVQRELDIHGWTPHCHASCCYEELLSWAMSPPGTRWYVAYCRQCALVKPFTCVHGSSLPQHMQFPTAKWTSPYGRIKVWSDPRIAQ